MSWLVPVLLLACGDPGPQSAIGPTYPQSVELPQLVDTQTYRATMLLPAAAKRISIVEEAPTWDLPGAYIALFWHNNIFPKATEICAPPDRNVWGYTVAAVAHEDLIDGTLDSCNFEKTFGVVRTIRIGEDTMYCMISGDPKKEALPADRITAEAICRSIFFEWLREDDPTLPSRFERCRATLSFGKNEKGEPAWLQHETCPPDHPYKRTFSYPQVDRVENDRRD